MKEKYLIRNAFLKYMILIHLKLNYYGKHLDLQKIDTYVNQYYQWNQEQYG